MANETEGKSPVEGTADDLDAVPEVAEADQVEESVSKADEDEDPLQQALAKADENWNQYLRTAAELDNVRKRASRDLENARRYGFEKFAAELLTVLDSLEMGIEAGENATAEALLEGKEATLKLLRTALEKFGVVEVNPEGETFDPEYHEAMSMQPSDSAEPGSVLTVVQKGYALKDRLLRPARVIVAMEPNE